MEQNTQLSPWHPISLFCTCGRIGNIPWAPGTWGSLIAFPLGFLFMALTNSLLLYGIAILVFFIAGTWASHIYMSWHHIHDAKEIVIDEVVGQSLVIWLATLGGQQFDDESIVLPFLVFGAPFALFFLFRLFDIIKPWPIDWIDKHVKGGFGVMLDDVAAALMTVTVFYASIFAYLDFVAK